MTRREPELEWSEKMKEKFKAGADIKHVNAIEKEKKRLDKFELLKQAGGPLTAAEQVEQYLADKSIAEKMKQQRMKMEIQFARDSTTTLPKADPLFRIKVVLTNKKRQHCL